MLGIGLLTIFCGGFLYLFRNTLEQAKKIINSGAIYTKTAVMEVATTWKPETFNKYASIELMDADNQAKIKQFLGTYSEKLGKIEKLGLLALSQTDKNVGRKRENGIVFEYFGDAKFAKAEGRVAVVLLNNKGDWKIVGMTVFSKALGNEANAPSYNNAPK